LLLGSARLGSSLPLDDEIRKERKKLVRDFCFDLDFGMGKNRRGG
jgi:hypothetical protein